MFFRNTLQLYKEAYAGHSSEVWSLTILTFINRTGTMVVAFLTVYLNTVLGFSLKDAGILVSAFGLGSLGGSYLGGKLSDRWGAHKVIVQSLFWGGVMFILMQFGRSFYSIFALIFAAALFGEAYRPALSAAIGQHVPPEGRGRTMALIRLAINLGFSAAPAIGGFVAVKLGYNWLFWIDGLTCIIAALYFAWASRNWKKPTKTVETNIQQNEQQEILPPYRNKAYLVFLLSTFLMGFGFIQWFHSIPVFVKTEWGFDERYIGSLFALNGLLVVIVEMPAVHFMEKNRKIGKPILWGLSLIVLSYLPFVFPAAFFLYLLAVVLFSFGEIFYLPFNNSLSINLSPESKRGDYLAWYWMCWSLVHITGPSLGLSFAEYFGFTAFWIFVSSLSFLALALNYTWSSQLLPSEKT